MLGELCSGCGSQLGFRKYKFRRQWKISGAYCHDCMIKVGKNFEESTTGTTTLERHQCSLCKNQFFFLQGTEKVGSRRGDQYCKFCLDVVVNGGSIQGNKQDAMGTRAPMPRSAIISGATGIMLMIAGLIFTFVNTPGQGGNLISVLFGSATTAAGFLLFRKTMQSRKMIYGKLNDSKHA